MPLERGQVYRVQFPPRQFGDRVIEGPHYAVVVQADAPNRKENYGNVVIVPFTSQEEKRTSHYPVQPSSGNGFDRVSFAMCEQVLTVPEGFLGEALTGTLTSYDVGQIRRGRRCSRSASR